MVPLTYVIALTGFWGVVYSSSQITVSCGQLRVEGYRNCEIMHENDVLYYTGPDKKIIPGLRLGLISFICDNYAGYLISSFDSKSCNPYWFLEGNNVPIYVGIITGLLLSSFCGGFLYYCLQKGLHLKLLNTGYYRVKKQNSEPNKDASTISMNESGETDNSLINSKTNILTENGEEHHRQDSTDKKGIAAVVFGLLLIKSASACDFTIHMDSNDFTTICIGTDCHDTPPYDFSPTLNHSICFEDQYGGVINMTIADITYRSRYELKYYTSNYKVMSFNSEGQCNLLSSSGSYYPHTEVSRPNCSSSGYMCDSAELASLKGQEKRGHNSHRGFKCENGKEYGSTKDRRHATTLSFFYCCRYSWEVRLIEKLYPVYQRIGQIWTVKLIGTENDNVQESQLTTYDPSFSLEGFRLQTKNTITLTVLDVKAQNVSTHNALLLHDDKLYNINAFDDGRENSFGEVKVSLTKDNVTFSPLNSSICEQKGEVEVNYYHRLETLNCTCQCTLPESKISSFLSTVENYTVSSNYLIRKNDSSVIDTFETYTEGTITLKLGDWKLNDSLVKKAKCDIEFVMSHGCSSSNKTPYIILASKNVETEGVVPFFSNCSFEKRYLRCDPYETVKLVLKEDQRACLLRMPTLKQKMVINIEYMSLDDPLHPLQTEYLKDASDEGFGSILTSEIFMKTLIITVIFCSAIGFIFNLIYRAHKRHKERIEIGTPSETALVQI